MKTDVMAQNNLSVLEDIDEIMAEMEAKTPKSGDKEKSFGQFSNGNEMEKLTESDSPPLKLFKVSDENKIIATVPDVVDAKGFWTTPPKSLKPGVLHPSKPTNERYYDFTHSSVGAALIFNQITVKGDTERKGSRKDATDLDNVLSGIGFDVKVCNDYSIREIRAELDACNTF